MLKPGQLGCRSHGVSRRGAKEPAKGSLAADKGPAFSLRRGCEGVARRARPPGSLWPDMPRGGGVPVGNRIDLVSTWPGGIGTELAPQMVVLDRFQPQAASKWVTCGELTARKPSGKVWPAIMSPSESASVRRVAASSEEAKRLLKDWDIERCQPLELTRFQELAALNHKRRILVSLLRAALAKRLADGLAASK